MLLVFLVGGAWLLYSGHQPEQLGFDPHAEIDPNCQYQIQLWDYRFPGPGYMEFFQSAVAHFEAQWPNVKVAVRFLPFGEGERILAESLQTSNPPDIYGTPDAWQSSIAAVSQQLLPAWPYFAAEERAGYHLASWFPSPEASAQPICWPRWLGLRAWLANQTILQTAGIDTSVLVNEGWDWESALQVLAMLKASNIPVTILNDGEEVFCDILAALAIPAKIDHPDASFHVRMRLRLAAHWLAGLRDQGLLRLEGQNNEKALVCYKNGRTAILAGAGPWLAAHCCHAEGWPATILLPPPHPRGGRPVARVEASAYFVFHGPGRDDGHLRVCAELARHLSRAASDWAASQKALLPAWCPEPAGLTWTLTGPALWQGPADKSLPQEMVRDFWLGKIAARDLEAGLCSPEKLNPS
jgi:hypothetical protein